MARTCDWCGCYMDKAKVTIQKWGCESVNLSNDFVRFCSNKCARKWEKAHPENEEARKELERYRQTDEDKMERQIEEEEWRRKKERDKAKKKRRFIVALAHIVAFIVNPCLGFMFEFTDNIIGHFYFITYSVIFFLTSWKDDSDGDKNIGNLGHLIIGSILGWIGFFALVFAIYYFF